MNTSLALSDIDRFLNRMMKGSVGFDPFYKILSETELFDEKGYPPYNIEKLSEETYKITIALAGFTREELTITTDSDDILIVEGSKTTDANDDKYLYKGIADRSFQRKFRLADSVKVKSAKLENGLLDIELERIIPEKDKPQVIEIS